MFRSLPDLGRAAVIMAELAHQIGSIVELENKSPQNVAPKYICHPTYLPSLWNEAFGQGSLPKLSPKNSSLDLSARCPLISFQWIIFYSYQNRLW